MTDITKLTGRLGNIMFWYAFGVNYARMHGITDSYFPQNPEWFAESDAYIKALYSEGIGKVDKVGIHVRRGDYLDPNRVQYGLPLSYYEKAMAMFPDVEFVVCSDDPKWCREQSLFDKCLISSGNELEDMNLLASCTRGLIIANSSFSWWSAYLNPHDCKIVAPEKWDKDNKIFPMPESWITL